MQLHEFVTSLPLGKIRSITRYKKGQHNDTYKITSDKGNFSLRIYKYKRPAQIMFELAILDCLKNTKAPQLVKLGNDYSERHKYSNKEHVFHYPAEAIQMFDNQSPQLYIKKFNDKYVIVYEYLLGKNLNTFTPEQLIEIGTFIAEFHNRCKHFSWKKYRYQFYNLPDWKIDKFAAISHAAHLKYLHLLPEIIIDLKANRLNKKLPKGPIHVDIKPENVLFFKGKLSGVLDFDNAFVGPFILDLAKSMVWFGTRNKQFHIKHALFIYKGYIQKRSLTALEQKELYKAITFAFLSHVFVDYYMRAINATTEEYFAFIVNDLYASYKTFDLTEREFNQLLQQ